MREPDGYGPFTPGVFDDDRLLACALGLDDDPELDRAASADPALPARLEAVRRDVACVERQIAATVPPAGDDYADPAGERWAGLREYVEPPREKATRRRARWLRVAVPVAAACALAAFVGLVALREDGGMSGSQPLSESTATIQTPQPQAAGSVAEMSFAEQVQDFRVVVLARAQEVTGVLQRFDVVRRLKGQAPDSIELRVGDTPALVDRLHLLLLRPLERFKSDGGNEDTMRGALAGKGADDGPGRPIPAAYAYNGDVALARELPAGADPASVTLP